MLDTVSLALYHVDTTKQHSNTKEEEVEMVMSYREYLETTKQDDTILAWLDWKVSVCGMTQRQAERAARNPEWGYSPLDN